MAIEKKYPSMKKFGTRYGRRVKEKFAELEDEQRKKHKCPYCNKVKVKRIASGIWQCRNCDAKFTGGAYTPSEKKVLKAEEEAQQEILKKKQKEPEEDEEESIIEQEA